MFVVYSLLQKLRKATISFFTRVASAVRMQQIGSRWKDFRDICYLRVFRKTVEKSKFSSKSDKNYGYYH